MVVVVNWMEGKVNGKGKENSWGEEEEVAGGNWEKEWVGGLVRIGDGWMYWLCFAGSAEWGRVWWDRSVDPAGVEYRGYRI